MLMPSALFALSVARACLIVCVLIICQVNWLLLPRACKLQQRLDVFVLELTLEVNRLIDPHADRLAEEFFSSHSRTELTRAFAVVADLVESRLDATRRHQSPNSLVFLGQAILDLRIL